MILIAFVQISSKQQVYLLLIHIKLLLITMSNFTQFLLCFAFAFLVSMSSGKKSQVEVLGFEHWQDPSPEQIKEQYAKLTQQYHENPEKNAAVEEKYRKVRQAFQLLKSRKFITIDDNPNNQVGINGQRGASGNRQEEQQRRNKRSEQFNYNHEYEPRYGGRQSYHHFDIDEILKHLDMDFVTLNQQEDLSGSEFVEQKKMDLQAFLGWLFSNPIIILAATLISIGIINLCTCCFLCCCCKCCRKPQQQKDNNQPNLPHNSPMVKVEESMRQKKMRSF